MCTISFKERVKNVVVANAPLYENNFLKYEYLVCSEAFAQGCHIIKADKGNYLHLTGIHTLLSPDEFFDKCVAGSGEGQLTEDDFDFNKPDKSEKSVKGSVREKISVLPKMMNLFSQELLVQDRFKKNRIDCAFAATDNSFTAGFVISGRPKSLLKGNELDKSMQRNVDLIFRKPRSSRRPYEELIYGDVQDVGRYEKYIRIYVSDSFFEI